jgi:hypothetical protein
MRFQLASYVNLKMNVLDEIIPLKTRKPIKPDRPKNQFQKPIKRLVSVKLRKYFKPLEPKHLKTYQTARIFQTEKIFQTARTQIPKNLSKPKPFQATRTLKLKVLSKTDCVSSGDINIGYNGGSYTQAGFFPINCPR